MALTAGLQAHSLRASLRRYWTIFSSTVIGDIIATAIAITAVAVLFLACSFALVALSHAGRMLLRLAAAR